MRRKTELRRYLLAALCSEDTPQTPDCQTGPIWENCDGPARVLDSFSGQIDEDSEAHRSAEISIVFRVGASGYQFTGDQKICAVTMNVEIDIVACGSDYVRQNALDEVESRILHRLLSGCSYTDAETGEELKPMLRLADHNTITMNSEDETDFDGKQAVRTLSFSFTTNPCIQRPCCEAKLICFDFSQLLRPDCE